MTPKSVRHAATATATQPIERRSAVTIYWHQTGPAIRYDGSLLVIEDLNPELRTQWRMSRWEMVRTGWRFIWAARLSS
jgi:hypothetical protein